MARGLQQGGGGVGGIEGERAYSDNDVGTVAAEKC